MEILENIPVELTVEQVLRSLHLDSDGKYAGDVQGLVDLVQDVVRPKAIYDVRYIDRKDTDEIEIGGVKFTSRVLRVNLDKVERIFPYIATCGTEVESIDIPSDDLMRRFVLDNIKQIALGAAVKHLREHIDRIYRPGQMSAMSPGSLEDWPISEQRQLFSIFGDVEKLIGVKLTDSYLMLPIKSISGIYFPTEVRFESCQLCPRERCPGRRAPYDEKLKEKYFSGENSLD
jgi:hypothetical protein